MKNKITVRVKPDGTIEIVIEPILGRKDWFNKPSMVRVPA